MSLKLWVQYIFNRKQYIKDLERFDLEVIYVEGHGYGIVERIEYQETRFAKAFSPEAIAKGEIVVIESIRFIETTNDVSL